MGSGCQGGFYCFRIVERIRTGRTRLVVALQCTGGNHRSTTVMLAMQKYLTWQPTFMCASCPFAQNVCFIVGFWANVVRVDKLHWFAGLELVVFGVRYSPKFSPRNITWEEEVRRCASFEDAYPQTIIYPHRPAQVWFRV